MIDLLDFHGQSRLVHNYAGELSRGNTTANPPRVRLLVAAQSRAPRHAAFGGWAIQRAIPRQGTTWRHQQEVAAEPTAQPLALGR
jgi:hypothetical protein